MSNKPITARSIKIISHIASNDNGHLCGTLDSIYFEEPREFAGVVEMIDIMETTFDTLGFPDKSLLPRTFGKAKERMRRYETDIASLRESLKKRLTSKGSSDHNSANALQGKSLATFEILVSFRHNAEWQGKLVLVDKNETHEFSSIVEMVKMMDEGVGSRE